ncbi:MAG: DUF418 domain-containing protein [Sphingomonas sp.]|uniref:DUF418 domain-containing protein n=1 Tax=Sphingomonas sp. TaxID=28214 RepID=UPI0025FECFD7|nr:DUF418 domain-containing protein [Sphingomonas sp.]MBX3563961.1 DUF418 domain-containing protein [Sphingomonas sp.]
MSAARLQSLDVVRGVAVMGILLLNIVGFGMPETAYFNPRAYGGADGLDLAVYLFNFVLFDGKMRGLFSFLFGASMLLVIERAEAKGESPARVHFSRMIWLLLFGLAHFYLLWFGDILNGYALIGMVAYLCYRMPPARQVGLALVLLLIALSLFVMMLPVTVHFAQLNPAAPGNAAMLRDLTNGFGIPDPSVIQHALTAYRGDYASVFAARIEEYPGGPFMMTFLFSWETLAYMLLGMVSLRSGLLRGEWEPARYRRWAWIAFAISIPAYTALAVYLINADFSLFAVALVFALSIAVRPVMVFGWMCLIILLARPGGWLTGRLAAAGRMAFSNYLGTSLICTTLFYGYGLGWFGHLGRAELYLVVLAIWALILLWSKPWLDHFRFGPFEWLWRSLARGRPQTMFGAAKD